MKIPLQSASFRYRSLGILSIVVLLAGFYDNSWHVADGGWFIHYQHDNESLVIGRIVKSRSDGIFSAGGLNGAGINHNIHERWITPEEIKAQYDAFHKGLGFDRYSPYMSQIGAQGMLFSLLDRAAPFSPKVKLRSFRMIASLASAAALGVIVMWFYREFGLSVMLFVLGSMVLSEWLTLLGRNLWWSMWAFYLPMIAVIYYFRAHRTREEQNPVKFGVLVLVFIFVKCLFNGYEYITATLFMTAVPLVYYAVLDRMGGRRFLKLALAATAGSFLAILLSFTVLSAQIGSVKGSFSAGIEHIERSFQKRTYGDPTAFPEVWDASLRAGVPAVLAVFLRAPYFDANHCFSVYRRSPSRFLFVSYWFLLAVFLSASLLLLFRLPGAFAAGQGRQNIALLYATWFSLLAPLSWFVIFKSHSYGHPHQDLIVWQMPFVFFGFAVVGAAARSLSAELALLRTRGKK